jgi:HAD superfamily hydrolase (TIGR01549 family)
MNIEKGLLFDLDGTLINSAPVFERCYIDVLCSLGAKADSVSFRRLMAKGSTDAQFLEAYGLDTSSAQDLFDKSLALYIQALTEEVEWYDDALEVVDYFSRRMPIGVVTSATRANIEAIDAKLGIRSRFNVFLDRQDTQGIKKPDPYPLRLGAEKLSVQTSNCTYVGDQTVDMLAAKASGMKGYLIHREHTPECAFEHASEVLVKLQELMHKF